METLEAIARRKSVRSYKQEQVSEEAMATIIKAGLSAPYAGPFQVSVVQKPALLKRLSEATLTAMKNSSNEFLRERASVAGYDPLYGAPTVVLITAPADSRNGAANAALAAENMILAATDLGLGTCYMGSPASGLGGEQGPELAAEIGIPAGYTVRSSVAIGYPAAGETFAPPKREGGKVNFVK